MITASKVLLLATLFSLSGTVLSFEQYNDGPYVFEKKNHREVIWICDGIKSTETVSLKSPLKIDHCGQHSTLWQASPKEVTQLEYKGDFKIAATSDIHGQFKLFIKLLKNNGIIDKDNRWSFSNGHFVITGDILDRGPQMTEALWFLYDLEKQAEQAGGKVHLLLGNHEVMVLNGDLRYLHEKYNETAKLLDLSFENLFAANSVLGDWLRSRPVLVKVNDMLFAHGGFHPKLAKKGLSIDKINQVFKTNLIESELEKPRKKLGKYLHKKNGPIWYRGYFKNKEGIQDSSPLEIEMLLKHFDITNIIVGHTTQDEIETRYNGKVIVIDARMKAGENGEILLWEKGKFERGLLSGEKEALN